MNLRTFLLISIAAVAFAECANAGDSTNESVSLASLPSVFFRSEYKVDPYMEAAGKLQALGKQAAIEQLIKLSRSPLVEAQKRAESGGGEKAEKEYEEIQRNSNSDALDERWKIAILCRMLFVPRQGSDFEKPGLGGTIVLGDHPKPSSSADSVFKKWPLEPIEIVDGIPFVVVWGLVYEGWVDPGGTERYVRYCATNCDWSNTQFRAKTKEQKEAALKKLISSSKWERPLEQGERDFLKGQLQ